MASSNSFIARASKVHLIIDTYGNQLATTGIVDMLLYQCIWQGEGEGDRKNNITSKTDSSIRENQIINLDYKDTVFANTLINLFHSNLTHYIETSHIVTAK